MYVAADVRDLSVFDLSTAEKRPVAEIQQAVVAGHAKMEAWLNIIRAAEEIAASHPRGCESCGVEDCSGGGEKCDERTRRLLRVRRVVPLDEALRVRTTPPVWRRIVKKHRDDLTTVYEMFKKHPAQRIQA